MFKILVKATCVATLLCCTSQVNAYQIGGAYATLIDCSWGKHGYEYGHIGTYKLLDGQIYTVYFGRNYCEY